MAQHRGLKLVKSRRRKPGTGDFGKFGLTDDKGKPLLGVSDEGLTASSADIENYLRAGAASTWQQSAKALPERVPRRNAEAQGDDPAGESVPRRHARQSTKPTPSPVRPARAEPPKNSKPKAQPAAEVPQDAPSLVIRAAKPGDADAVAKLLRQLSGVVQSDDDIARHLAALRKAGAGLHVAELGRLVGCVGWAVVPTIHRGPVGRITVLVVDEGHRRVGTGTKLLATVEDILAKKGCTLIEVMSDIEIKNSHNFFRTLKFEQTSYRFTRKITI
jgi:N-acetylglutamate synthase-like GNAT family acetyltransferase